MKINQQKIIIAVIVILALVAGAIWFFVYLNQEETSVDEGGNENLFPFGEILPGSGLGSGGNQGTTGEGEITQPGQETEDSTTVPDAPALQLISNEPTGGFVPLTRVEEKEIVTDQISQEGIVSQLVETIEVENSFVRFSSIDDGSVYETRLTGDNPLSQELIVENFIPNAEHSTFSNSGQHVAFQYWDNNNRSIETYLGRIDALSLEAEVCPYDFSGPVVVGEESDSIYDIHQFLNRDVRTQVSTTGVNSPGNESPLGTEASIAAIESFQTLYGLEVDGAVGSQTRGEMLKICNEQQEQEAKEKLEELDTKYEISGFFLPENILSINMDPENEQVFYLQKDNSGVVGILRTLQDQTRRTIFSSPHSEWTSSWGAQESIEITTKPSYAADGYSYELEVEDGDFHKSFPSREGLMVLPSNSGEKLLVHDVRGERPGLSIYERATNRFLPLSLETFTDKCVWSDSDVYIYCAVPHALAYGEEYPDTWYQGRETYRDSLWRINTENLQERVLSNIEVDYGQSIDVEKIDVDDKDRYLYFIDKNSEFLWSYRIDQI